MAPQTKNRDGDPPCVHADRVRERDEVGLWSEEPGANPMRATLIFGAMLLAAGCQDFSLKGHGDTVGGGVVAPTIFHVVVRDGMYSGLWSKGVIDRSKSCAVEGDAGEDYTACCPGGFTPFGFWDDEDPEVGEQAYGVNCMEDEPQSPRAVLYVAGGWTSDDWDYQTSWVASGAPPTGWTPGGTWSNGKYTYGGCAVDVRDDQLPVTGYHEATNPPDDYTACCPMGFTPVGQAKAGEYLDVVCLQNAE